MRHSSDNVAIDLLAIAILRREDSIVLVQQQMGSTPGWVTPGGLVESGELVTEALIREVREETGAEIHAISNLAFVMQIDRPVHRTQTVAYVFEVAEWTGDLKCQDPDDEIICVELMPITDAIKRLDCNGGWPSIQTPLIAYLRGEVAAGAFWSYRETDGQRYISRIPG